MTRCVYKFGTENQCKRQEYPFCCVHKKTNDKRCGVCKLKTYDKPKITLSNCRHIMCIECFVKDVFEVQWFSGFTNRDPIFCPCCLGEVSQVDWFSVIRILMTLKCIEPIFTFDNNNTYKITFRNYQPPENIDISHRITLTEHVEYIEI
jgi:hypothetical protein